MSEPLGILAEDYRFTADLLREHIAAARDDLFRAVCSNNINIILAALDAAEKHAQQQEDAV